MSYYIRRADSVDVMIFAEGTYPYIRGGVSSWIHQLITQLSTLQFGICFIGSQKSDYGEIRYELPQNLVHLEVHYMFGEKSEKEEKFNENPNTIMEVEKLYASFTSSDIVLPDKFHELSFFQEELTEGYFLHSKGAWDYLNRG